MQLYCGLYNNAFSPIFLGIFANEPEPKNELAYTQGCQTVLFAFEKCFKLVC